MAARTPFRKVLVTSGFFHGLCGMVISCLLCLVVKGVPQAIAALNAVFDVAGVALVASYIPSRRAAKVDPMTALR